jgi:hypothetical protein
MKLRVVIEWILIAGMVFLGYALSMVASGMWHR